MNRSLLPLAVAAALAGTFALGCASPKKSRDKIAKNRSVADVAPAPLAGGHGAAGGTAFAFAPMAPVTPQPVAFPAPAAAPYRPAYAMVEPALLPPATDAPAPIWAAGSLGGGSSESYQVQKGDTLFGIAKSRYGSGNQWQRIAAANPGVTPASLKAGATIVVP